MIGFCRQATECFSNLAPDLRENLPARGEDTAPVVDRAKLFLSALYFQGFTNFIFVPAQKFGYTLVPRGSPLEFPPMECQDPWIIAL